MAFATTLAPLLLIVALVHGASDHHELTHPTAAIRGGGGGLRHAPPSPTPSVKKPDPSNVFGLIDKDGDGRLSSKEVEDYLIAFKDTHDQAHDDEGTASFNITEIMTKEDEDHDGYISWNEFTGPKGRLHDDAAASTALELIDTDITTTTTDHRELHHAGASCFHEDNWSVPRHDTRSNDDKTEEAADGGYVIIAGVRISRDETKYFYSCNHRNGYTPSHGYYFHMDKSWNYLKVRVRWEESFWGDSMRVDYYSYSWIDINRNPPTDGIPVKIEHQGLGDAKCLEVGQNGRIGVGIPLAFETCQDPVEDPKHVDAQTFYMKFNSDGTFSLRPKRSVDAGYNVCVPERHDNDMTTADCTTVAHKLTILSGGIRSVDDNPDNCIVNEGDAAMKNCADVADQQKTKLQIKTAGAEFTFYMDGRLNALDDPIPYKFAGAVTYQQPDGNAVFLYGGTSLVIKGADWKQFEFGATRFLITENSLFEYNFSASDSSTNLIAICLVTSTTGGPGCFVVYNEDGGSEVVVSPTVGNRYVHQLGEFVGSEISALAFVQGDRSNLLGSSSFDEIMLLDTVDIVRYAGCYGGSSSILTADQDGLLSYDQCHKRCFDGGYTHFARTANHECRCGSPGNNFGTTALGCDCASSSNIGSYSCVYGVAPINSESGQIRIYQNGNALVLSESSSSTLDAGFVTNMGELNGIAIFGHKYLRMPLSMTIISETILEFDFTYQEEAQQHGVCIVEGANDLNCKYILGTKNELETNTNGGYGTKGQKSSYRLKVGEEGRTYSATGLVFLQDNSDTSDTQTLRSGHSLFENVMIYSLKASSVTSRTKDDITIAVDGASQIPSGIFFKAEVLVQDSKGDYSRVPAAENAASRMDPSNVVITKLEPGRRYSITLLPVDNKGVSVPREQRHNKAIAITTTTCSCTSEISGAPQNLQVNQKGGLISMKFRDNSVCEEAFGFSRTDVESGDIDSYAPNFLFYSTEECSASELVSPGEAFGDDINRSRLVVGKEYLYCVRSVAKEYMVSTTNDNGEFVTSSNAICDTHTLHWEASAKVKLTLRKDAGALPVKDAIVTYSLLHPNDGSTLTSGTLTTPDSGEVLIEFNELELNGHQMDETKQYPLKISMSKTTGDVVHEFLCDDEAVVCPAGGVITYLSHLDFGVKVQIVDSTSLKVEGTVTMGWANYEDSGCPLQSAQVCLFRKQTGVIGGVDSEDVCVDTDTNGQYALPATIGTRVYPKVQFAEHDFVYLNPSTKEADFDRTDDTEASGILITEEGSLSGLYRNHDFLDTNTTDLIVEVAGGPCNINLGSSAVEVKICSAQNGKKVFPTQDGVTASYRVPAQQVEVRISSIAGRGDFITEQATANGFFGQYKLLDLSEVDQISENDEAMNSTNSDNPIVSANPAGTPENSDANAAIAEEEGAVAEDTNTVRTARFQYDGTLIIDAEMDPDDIGAKCLGEGKSRSTEQSTSRHVIGSQETFDVTVFLRYEIFKAEGADPSVFCDDVSGEKVSILSTAGLVATLDRENEVLALLEQSGTGEEDMNLYRACTLAECILDVQPPAEGQSDPKSKVVQTLKAGIPELNAPFEKTITIQALGKAQRHTMFLVVTGDYKDGVGNIFLMPTHFPLLVIRDPPGGESSATYENVQTTVKITMDSFERYDGIDGGLSVGIGPDSEVDVCAGLGAAVCNKMLDLDMSVGAEMGLGSNFLTDFRDDTRSHGFTVTWSYSTSAEQIYAGSRSDAFLVPTIAILYVPTVTVAFDQDTCVGSESKTTKFDLAAPENKRAMAFVPRRHLEKHLLPKLRTDINNLDQTDGNYEASRSAMQASIDSWEGFLSEYYATNGAAEAGTLENVGSWYRKHAAEQHPLCEKRTSTRNTTDYFEYRCTPSSEPNIQELYGDTFIPSTAIVSIDWTEIESSHAYWADWEFFHPAAESPNTPLGPNSLIENAEINDATAEFVETSSILESTGRIFFAGGGSSVSFTLTSEQMSELQSKWDAADLGQNSDVSFNVGVEGEMSIGVASFGVDLGMNAGYTLETSHTMLTENDGGLETSISFELYDPDEGDEFLVDVFIDPVYGTFVFHTVSGRSMCPHEDGTDPGEVPRMLAVSPIRFVQEDEPMVFNITLWNDGEAKSDMVLYIEDEDNTMGLDITFPEDYLGLTGEKNYAEVIIERGPLAYEYPPLGLILRSKCEMESSWGGTVEGNTLVEVELYNHVKDVTLANGTVVSERSINFIEPCLSVHFAGDIGYRDTFVINDQIGDALQVRIYNPDSSKRTMNDAPRVEKVLLEYRRVGDLNWLNGQTTLDDGTVDIDFAAQGVEDAYGFAQVDWKLPTEESMYEIRVKTVCSDGGSPAMNFDVTDVVTGIIDRSPPEVYGHPDPQVNLVPGEELVVQFTEDIFCQKPYRFDVMLSVADIGLFSTNDIDITCNDNVIGIQFRADSGGYDQFLGRDYTLTIRDVDDLSLNRLQEYTYESNFLCRPPEPELTITHPAGSRPYLPFESIEFEATLTNNGRALSYAELGVDLRTNSADFEVRLNGEPLALVQEYTLDAGETITTTISIRKGPGKNLKFTPITVFLRSSCDADGHNPMTVTADLCNYQDGPDNWIAFTSPCPAIRFAGPFNNRPRFVLNKPTLENTSSLLEISIFNEDYMDRTLYDRSVENAAADWSNRLQDVVLMYRRVGDEDWTVGITQKNNGSTMEAAHFAGAGIEDEFGYSTLSWDVTAVPDSEYELRVVSRCTSVASSHHNDLDEYSTTSVIGVIDRVPPAVYGIPTLELPPEMHPSAEFVIPFTEPIYCQEPFDFDLTAEVEIDGTTTTLSDKDGIYVKCEGDQIRYRFDSLRFAGDAYSSLFGSTIKLTLSNVEDAARNVIESPYESTYAHCNSEYVRSHEVFQMMGCNGRDDDCDFVVDECDEDLIPPILTLNQSLPTSIHQDYPDALLIADPRFKTIEDARSFLFQNVMAKDDCAKELDVDVSSPRAACGETLFTVTISDPRCSDINPIQTVSKDFILRVDGEAPTISVGFDRQKHRDHYDDENLYLHVSEVDRDFYNVLLHYDVTDNCPQNVKVEIAIFSNQYENHNQPLAAFAMREDVHQSRQTQVFVKPQVCASKFHNKKALCEHDDEKPARFYDIRLTATDFAGNQGFDNVTVIVIPESHDPIETVEASGSAYEIHDPMLYIYQIWPQTVRRHIITEQFEYTVE